MTGSDLALIQDARMRFPGRRGRAGTVDFHLCPLNFREFVCLKDILGLKDLVDPTIVPSRSLMELLFEEFRTVHDIPAEPLPLALLRLREVFKTADLQTFHRRSQH